MFNQFCFDKINKVKFKVNKIRLSLEALKMLDLFKLFPKAKF